MNISRKHAIIAYNFTAGQFELKLLGKNGLSVGDKLFGPDDAPCALSSGDVISGTSCRFHFFLPRDREPLQSRNGMSALSNVAPSAPAAQLPAQPGAAMSAGPGAAPAAGLHATPTPADGNAAAAAHFLRHSGGPAVPSMVNTALNSQQQQVCNT